MNVRTPRPGLSLKRQLLLWLLLPQLVLWSVGGVLAWRLALRYADTGIDQSLKQSVRALARQVKPVGSGLLVDFPRAAQDVLEQDPTDRMGYMVSSPPGSFVLGNGKLPPPPDGILIQVGEPVIYDARVADKRVRVALLDVTYGEPDAPQRLRVQVAKSLAVQERVARELVFDMLVPLAALGVLLGLLINAGIARGLRPLKRLEAQPLAEAALKFQRPDASVDVACLLVNDDIGVGGLVENAARDVGECSRWCGAFLRLVPDVIVRLGVDVELLIGIDAVFARVVEAHDR